jgi:hypothetical protein
LVLQFPHRTIADRRKKSRVNREEITIFDTPKYNWGIRVKSGDEISLPYKVIV